MAELPRYAIDASAAGKWHLQDEAHTTEADDVRRDLQNGDIELVAPSLISVEVGAAIRRAVIRGRLSIAQAAASLDEIPSWGVQLIDPPLLTEALSLSQRFGCSFYDSIYLALADDLGVPLIHADEKLRRALAGRFTLEMWIEDYPN